MADGYVHYDILEVLRNHWGYGDFRPKQREIIESVLEGADTLGLLPTGGGKSLTFQVPALCLDGLTVVVTPLISLMKDQVDNLRAIGIPAYFLHAALTPRETRLALDKCRLGKARLLYLSPEKLQSPSFVPRLRELPIRLIVVDEAHCISQWGYDFRPSYLKIALLREAFPEAPVLALTASATPEVVEDIMDRLRFRRRDRVFRRSFSRENLSYIVRLTDYKEGELLHILSHTSGSAIVYTRSRRRTRQMAEYLCSQGLSAEHYHAGLSAEEKTERQNRWKAGQTRIMVATNAFGMGIDKPDVRTVVHVDLPSSLEEYYQEAGRAGRDGLPSYAVVVATPRDRGVLQRRLSETFPEKDYIRRVYEQLCVFLNVGMGEGFNQLYEMNLPLFCLRNRLQDRQADSALRLLSQAGHITYQDEVSTRSRIMMTMTRRELYDLSLDEREEAVLQYVLRNYTGIFADYEYISEPAMAMDLRLTEREIYESMLRLSRLHVLHFVPHRSTPYIYFPQSRIPTSDVLLPREIYELRRRRMAERIEAMTSFVFDASRCRVQAMLRYFGELEAPVCGHCDVCRARGKSAAKPKSSASNPSGEVSTGQAPTLEEWILSVLAGHASGLTVAQLAAAGNVDPRRVATACRRLLEASRLSYDSVSALLSVTR